MPFLVLSIRFCYLQCSRFSREQPFHAGGKAAKKEVGKKRARVYGTTMKKHENYSSSLGNSAVFFFYFMRIRSVTFVNMLTTILEIGSLNLRRNFFILNHYCRK